MTTNDKIMEGLEIAYQRLIEFKKYKKTPIIVAKDGKVIEVSPYDIKTGEKVYKKQ
jgi:sulfur carrier protein ThiS